MLSSSVSARLVWGSLAGTALSATERRLLAHGLGGVVLFSRNVESPGQVAALVAEIREAATGPVRIAIDQEGGHVTRIGPPLTWFGPPMALGATGDAALARAVARASGRELAALGIDVVLAPVVDLAADLRSTVMGARAFGDDPWLVGQLGAAMTRGYLEGGVLPMPKHFPGHGRTPADTHRQAARIGGTASELELLDLPPFRAVVDAGAPALMTAHVVHAAIDPDVPASLSGRAVIAARERLDFGGLLVTDAIVMDAITSHLRLEDAAVAAIAAGNDVVMGLEGAARCVAGIGAGIASGLLAPGRVSAALERIEAYDRLAAAIRGTAAARRFDASDHGPLAERLARASLTLVDAGSFRPLQRGARVLLVDVGAERTSPIEEAFGESGLLGAAIRGRFPDAAVRAVDGRSGARLDAALAEATHADWVLLATRDVFASAAGPFIVAQLAAVAGERAIHVALRSPADLLLPGPAARIAAYADTPATALALADAFGVGPAAFPGRLPVALRPGAVEAVA